MFRRRKKNSDDEKMEIKSEKARKEDNQITTLINEGCSIEGGVYSKNSARIEGVLKGTAKVDQTFILGEKGHIIGDISAKHVVIFGKVEGKINAGKLEIKDTGNIVGDIAVEVLVIESGGVFNGNSSMEKAKELSENIKKVNDKLKRN